MKNIFDNKITIPNIQLSQYESKLEQGLMTHPKWRGGEQNIFMKRLAIVGVSLGILLFTFITYTSYSSHSGKSGAASKAYAQEVAEKSYQSLLEISEEKRSALVESVKEAKNAADLTLLTYTQFAALYPQFTPEAIGLLDQKEQYVQGKFLQYTNSKGEKGVLGIGQNDIPFLNLLPEKKEELSSTKEKAEKEQYYQKSKENN